MSDAWVGVSERLAEHWWAFALRGVVAILFGIFAFVMPGITLAVLLGFFAAYMAIDGVLAITAAVRAMREHRSYLPLLLESIADIAAAVIAIVWPGITLIALVYLTGAWAVVSGVLLAVAAMRMDRAVEGRIWLMLSGILSAVFGVLLFLLPVARLPVLPWWIVGYSVV